MRGASYNSQLAVVRTLKLFEGGLIGFHSCEIQASYQEKRGGFDLRELAAGEIWPTAAGNNRENVVTPGGCLERGGRPHAHPEVADVKFILRAVGRKPIRRGQKALGE